MTGISRDITNLAICLTLLFFAGRVGQAYGGPLLRPSGTFIQHSLAEKWDDAAWQKELGYLKEAGFQYLVVGPAVETSKQGVTTAFFDTGQDSAARGANVVGACLRNAGKMGFRVFIGLNFSPKWWLDFDEAWLQAEMDKGNETARDLMQKYGADYPVALHGWYWFWEVDNVRFNDPRKRQMIANAINRSRSFLHDISPGKPFMLCPFMNSKYGTAPDYGNFWTEVFKETDFRKGDIFAPQDCVGAGGLTPGEVPLWFRELARAVKTRPELEFWADVETFDQRFWTSATLDRFIAQLDAVQPYVSNILTFAYSHYYSPNKADGSFHEAYLFYLKNGRLPSKGKLSHPGRWEARLDAAGTRLVVQWAGIRDDAAIAGYRIYLGDMQVADVQGQALRRKTFTVRLDTIARKTDPVKIEVYACTGEALSIQSGKLL